MKVKRAYLITVNGVLANLPTLEGKEISLKDMYPIIGCDCVEHVSLGDGIDMWIDESGKLKQDVQVNAKATRIFRKVYPVERYEALCLAPDYIVGNVIITDNTKEGRFLLDFVDKEVLQ